MTVVASVATLLALAGCGSHDHADPPPASSASHVAATSTAAAVGPPPRISWWSDGKLHFPDGLMRTRMRRIVERGGTTIVGRETEQASHWVVLRELGVAHLPTGPAPSRPIVSANGRYAAWTTSSDTHRYGRWEADTSFNVTAYDVGRGRVTGTTVVESHTTCCDGGGVIAVAGVDNDGSVVIGRYSDRAWIWRPGRPPIQLVAPARPRYFSGNDQWPGGVSWTTTGNSGGPAIFARVSAAGVVIPVGRVPQTQGGLWSPQGTAYAYSPVVKERRPRPVVWRDGRRLALQAPRGSWPLAWESDHRVLVVVGDLDRSIRLMRCWVGNGRCEQAGPLLRHAQVSDTTRF